MNRLYTIDELKQIETAALASLPVGELMQRAGQAAAELARQLLPKDKEARVLVLVGPGNNGGDALETASRLAKDNIKVSGLHITGRQKPSAEASMARKNAINSAIEWEDALSMTNAIKSISAKKWDLVIDGMFGIGLKEGLNGNRAIIIEFINSLECPILALDVPSGLNANTGSIVGQEGVAIKATHTITFIGNKPGLHTLQGKDYAGKIYLATLGLDNELFLPTNRWLNDVSLFSSSITKRLHDSHKGTYGRVAIAGGGNGMYGAVILSGRTALKCGVGLCYVVFLKDPPGYDPVQPELMLRVAHCFDFSQVDVIAAGPGLGQTREAYNTLTQVLHAQKPLILDADAINLIASHTDLQHLLADHKAPLLMTPHPLEAARLLGTTAENVQLDRINSAEELAARYNTIVILKGSGTVIASPNGKSAINPTGSAALATAGSGDVLTGICAALVCQGWPFWEAALAGVWMHGAAADELNKQGIGPIGLAASEIIPVARSLINRLTAEFG